MAVSVGLRIASAVTALLFLLFAIVQYNDPDALVWIAMYTLPALASLTVAAGKRLPAAVPIAIGLAALLWAAALLPEALRQPVTLRQLFGTTRMLGAGVEEMREMLGLLLVATGMGLLLWGARAPE